MIHQVKGKRGSLNVECCGTVGKKAKAASWHIGTQHTYMNPATVMGSISIIPLGVKQGRAGQRRGDGNRY